MHELSIANRLVEIIREHADLHGAARVGAVTLRIGALSCVHRGSLEFCFKAAAATEKLLEAAELKFVDVPVAIFCANCHREVELPGIQQFRCPACGTLGGDIRRGRELEIETIELLEAQPMEI